MGRLDHAGEGAKPEALHLFLCPQHGVCPGGVLRAQRRSHELLHAVLVGRELTQRVVEFPVALHVQQVLHEPPRMLGIRVIFVGLDETTETEQVIPEAIFRHKKMQEVATNFLSVLHFYPQMAAGPDGKFYTFRFSRNLLMSISAIGAELRR